MRNLPEVDSLSLLWESNKGQHCEESHSTASARPSLGVNCDAKPSHPMTNATATKLFYNTRS